MPGGAIKYVHAVAHLMEAAPGTPQLVGALMDVTAARQSEIRLHQAQAQVAHVARVTSLGALSASIAHEVNQPLAAIASHGEASMRWLHRDVPRLDEVEASIRHVIAEGRRASEIIQRIRALTGKADQEKRPLDLNGVVEEVVPLVRARPAGIRHSYGWISLRAYLPSGRHDPAAAGDHQPDRQCHPGYGGGRRPSADRGRQHALRREWRRRP